MKDEQREAAAKQLGLDVDGQDPTDRFNIGYDAGYAEAEKRIKREVAARLKELNDPYDSALHITLETFINELEETP